MRLGTGFDYVAEVTIRPTILLLGAIGLAGCASQPHPVPSASYQSAPAAALAFDPPVLAGTPRLDLSREDRGPAAFFGFVDSSTTVSQLSVDDSFADGCGGWGGDGDGGATRDYYQRDATSQTINVVRR